MAVEFDIESKQQDHVVDLPIGRLIHDHYIDRILTYRETSGAIEIAITATAIPAATQISLIMHFTSWSYIVYLDALKCILASGVSPFTASPSSCSNL